MSSQPRKPAKHVYRAGDKVRIQSPQVIERIGYPLSLGTAIEHVRAKHGSSIVQLINIVAHDEPPHALHPALRFSESPDEGVLRALAYVWLKAEGFGGKERSIHTTINEALRGLKAVVLGKRVVKTGRYNHGTTDYCADGIPDFTPPYLGDEKTHVLLKVEVIPSHVQPLDDGSLCGAFEPCVYPSVLEIEECHVVAAGFDLREALALMDQRSDETISRNAPF